MKKSRLYENKLTVRESYYSFYLSAIPYSKRELSVWKTDVQPVTPMARLMVDCTRLPLVTSSLQD